MKQSLQKLTNVNLLKNYKASETNIDRQEPKIQNFYTNSARKAKSRSGKHRMPKSLEEMSEVLGNVQEQYL